MFDLVPDWLARLLFPKASKRLALALGDFDRAIIQLEKAADECAKESMTHAERARTLQLLQQKAAADSYKAATVAIKLKELIA